MHSAEKALQIRQAKRDEIFTWFGKQPEEIRLEIFKKKIDTYHRWASQDGRTRAMPAEQVDYAALMSAIMNFMSRLRSGKTSEDFELRVKAAKAQKKARLAPEADLVEREYLPLIKRLLDEGLSWRQVSLYIEEHHHKKFPHSYLYKIYKQWEPRSVENSGVVTTGTDAEQA